MHKGWDAGAQGLSILPLPDSVPSILYSPGAVSWAATMSRVYWRTNKSARFLIKKKSPAFVVLWADGKDAFSAWGAPGMLGGGRWGWWGSGPRRGGEPRYVYPR